VNAKTNLPWEAAAAAVVAVVLETEEAEAVLPVRRSAFRLAARRLLRDAVQVVPALPQVARAEAAVCAAAQRCRDCRLSSPRMTALQRTT
jgi:hypothetical protein